MIHYMVKKWCVEFKNMGGGETLLDNCSSFTNARVSERYKWIYKTYSVVFYFLTLFTKSFKKIIFSTVNISIVDIYIVEIPIVDILIVYIPIVGWYPYCVHPYCWLISLLCTILLLISLYCVHPYCQDGLQKPRWFPSWGAGCQRCCKGMFPHHYQGEKLI